MIGYDAVSFYSYIIRLKDSGELFWNGNKLFTLKEAKDTVKHFEKLYPDNQGHYEILRVSRVIARKTKDMENTIAEQKAKIGKLEDEYKRMKGRVDDRDSFIEKQKSRIKELKSKLDDYGIQGWGMGKMKIKTIIDKWYFVILICLQAWWFNLFHIFEDQAIIHAILTFMLAIGIGGSMCYVLFHGIEEQKKREAMISKEVAERL